MGLTVLPEGCPGYECDPVRLAMIQQVVPLPVGEAVPVLHRDDRHYLPCPFNMLQGDVGQAHMPDLSLFALPRQRLDGRIKRNRRIRYV